MSTPNPCPVATQYPATNSKNSFVITVTIDDDAWDSLPEDERLLAKRILDADEVLVLADIAAKGDCIKRESNGWTIHTATNKSLYDTNISKGDAGKKVFVFDTYKKRPH